MSSKNVIKIRLMIRNFSEESLTDILKKMKKLLGEKYYNVKIDCNYTKKYWKIPELRECICVLHFHTNVDIKDITELIANTDFFYEESSSDYDLDEEVVWDIHTHGGKFLSENIEWVHVYR
ncbi:hypothetical protein ACFLYH_02900 [Candidatus Dependentiae bacterium]